MSDDLTWLTGRPSEVLECGRFRLRRWSADDLVGLVDAVMDSIDELRHWMPWASDDYGPGDAAAFLASATDAWDRGTDFPYAIEEPDGTIIGSCGLHPRRDAGSLEIGYWVRSSHVGRGIATITSAALADAGLRVDGVDRVEIHCDRANERSARIPRRLGFAFVGEEPDGADAPGEEGIDLAWVMTAADHPGSPAQRFLAEVAG